MSEPPQTGWWRAHIEELVLCRAGLLGALPLHPARHGGALAETCKPDARDDPGGNAACLLADLPVFH
ncbi:hypothetical protein [Catellatospora methionotrophica]|uniref:hypothetical protein n=1 Tax=Catellatospora methionotrophica TaxID=121620 RepID=UPI0033E80037